MSMAEIDEQLYKELIDKIKTYHPSDDFSMVEKAYKLAVEAHKEQKRKSTHNQAEKPSGNHRLPERLNLPTT